MSLKYRTIGTVLSLIVVIIYARIIEHQKESRKEKEELERIKQEVRLRENTDSIRAEVFKKEWDKDSAERNERNREMIKKLKKWQGQPFDQSDSTKSK
jgi:hypothetical protein